ncbi:lyase family protein [Pseudonocardia sp.]|uniref:lyase family protein n=1 Tax=Pseudonocardia sp. TaxID=60912 RepID=UPI003D0E6B01
MTELFLPGDHRAGDLLTPAALLRAMAAVEAAWLAALGASGLGPGGPVPEITGEDLPRVAGGSEAGGNPVIPLVVLLRERAEPSVARWVHRGLTSQDVLDTALMLCVRDAAARVRAELVAQAGTLSALAQRHRHTPMAGRTLTQHAVPVTFGLKAATWLAGVLDAHTDVAALRFPAQFGGAAGTLAATAELARVAGSPEPPATAVRIAVDAAAGLGLDAAPPWHTARAPVTRVGDALVRATDAWGRIAADVLTASRPEIGELAEGTAGGSSTMPHKANPVLSVLIRRAALTAPDLAARLHLAAADARDERPDGAWHLEWDALRELGRGAVSAGSQASELLAGLRVHPERMRATLDAAAADLLAERRGLHEDGDPDPASYTGAADLLVDAALQRARAILPEEQR